MTEKNAKWTSMKWLLTAAQDKELTVHLPEKLAWELVDAHNNQVCIGGSIESSFVNFQTLIKFVFRVELSSRSKICIDSARRIELMPIIGGAKHIEFVDYFIVNLL